MAHATPAAVGVAGYAAHPVAHAGYGKREAEAEAEAAPEAEADAGHYGYAAGPVAASAPVCTSVPVKTCNKVPVSTPRKVGRTVCKTVEDITTIEDCEETITTECTQIKTQVSRHSAVVGHDTKVGPAEVVAHAAPVAPVAVAHAGPVVAGYSGYGLAGYGRLH